MLFLQGEELFEIAAEFCNRSITFKIHGPVTTGGSTSNHIHGFITHTGVETSARLVICTRVTNLFSEIGQSCLICIDQLEEIFWRDVHSTPTKKVSACTSSHVF